VFVPYAPAPVSTAPPQAAEPPPLVASVSAQSSTARMPREIRIGTADMVIQRVEEDVPRADILAAIEPLISSATVCMRWPALWLERGRLLSLTVRYAHMARDWGEDAARSAESQMDEFVELGFLTKRGASQSDARAIEYTLTPEGERYFSGAIEPGRRPSFCAPAERRLVDITSIEWGEYPCGTMQVRFRHVGENWPAWARTEASRARLAAEWPPLGEPASGTVSLSRLWYRRDAIPPNFTNGSLQSLCYDASRRVVTGADLNLSAAPLEAQ
jgi:hypothetical protein